MGAGIEQTYSYTSTGTDASRAGAAIAEVAEVVDGAKRVSLGVTVTSSTASFQAQLIEGGVWVDVEAGITTSKMITLNSPAYAVRVNVTAYTDAVTFEVKAVKQ